MAGGTGLEITFNFMEKIGGFEKKIDQWSGDLQEILEMSPEQIQDVLRRENDFFVVPGGDKTLLDRAVEADDFFFETVSYCSDHPQDPKGLPIKTFRSLEWQTENPKDKEYSHQVIYRASCDEVAREYLPKDLQK